MDKGFELLERLIYAANTRHRVLSSNIANTDTPNYRAKDVDFKSFLAREKTRLVVTDPRHISTAGGGESSGDITPGTSQSWGDGNNVELDMEIAKLTENGLLYQAAVRLLSIKIGIFRNALKR
jgi:flagellar basal-body rod protein FlgB